MIFGGQGVVWVQNILPTWHVTLMTFDLKADFWYTQSNGIKTFRHDVKQGKKSLTQNIA